MNEPSRVSSSSGHSASIKQGGSSHPPCMVLHPPPHFSYLEENLCHCFGPLNKSHISFLSHIGIQRILNYSMRKFDSTILSHFETVGIHHVHHLSTETNDFNICDIVKFEEWLALNVEDIISHSSHAATLIVGNSETYLDCVVLACWRRVQSWSTVNILAEFRMYTWPHRLLDFEQMIERFNTELVDVISLSPEFHVIHSNLQEEEYKLIDRHHQIEAGTCTGNDDDQDRIDQVLFNLFFPKQNILISEASSFDPAISLVNEKDDDD